MSDEKSKNDRGPVAREIRVGALARVEGEGAFSLSIRDGRVERACLEIYEPPRLFEAFLRGRDFREVPDITARICGICPVAYQASACHALEKALGIFDKLETPIRDLRDLFYCGEWIESHVLHIFLLHLPDFLGYESAISMAQDHREIVRRALRVKRAGNEVVALLGGRSVHPVGMCVGGFYASPDEASADRLGRGVEEALSEMVDLTRFLAAKVDYPVLERDYEFVALCPDGQYPMNLGRIKSNRGLDVDPEEFEDAFEEIQVGHSTALHARLKGRGSYVVGPLARLNLNHEKLHPEAAALLPGVCESVKAALPWRNSYLAMPARALETVHALALARDILKRYRRVDPSYVPVGPRAGQGAHATEAPRGLLWHRYRTEEDGSIAFARIVPPTSQNQAVMEEDLAELGARLMDLPDEEAALKCEHLIRNYDPCISCSTHFLKFRRNRLDTDAAPPPDPVRSRGETP
ncbi:MAG: Ni/Fe hydrogenase subunit alpha [bacterium]